MESSKKLIWTERSIIDIEDIYDFLAVKSVAAANTTTQKIFDKPQILLQQGFECCGQVDDINPKYRRLIQSNYKLLYSVTDDAIIINRVFDCRKDPEKLKESFKYLPYQTFPANSRTSSAWVPH